MNHLLHRLLPVIAGICCLSAAAQSAADPPVRYEAETMASLSTGSNTPFWLIADREGLGSVKRNTGYIRAAIERRTTGRKRVTWGFGADLVAGWRAESPFTVRQLYGEARYRDFLLSIGPKCLDDTARLVNRRLSSGDLLFSGNSLPIPEVRLAMPEYLDIPGLRHWLGFKAYISYGIFSDSHWQKSYTDGRSNYTRNVLFHSKGLFLRIGPQSAPFSFEGALEMAAQFGGTVLRGDKVILSLPHGLKDFWKITFPSAGGSDSPMGEQTNILGNHTGEWSARLNWRPAGRSWQLSAYYLHFFEDHSMMLFDYPWRDGLFGLEYRNPAGRWLTGAVYEFISTTDQAGPVYWDHTDLIPEQVSGTDDYYNHFIYNGWEHWGMGIGNPLLISPVYNSNGSLAFQCTRLRGHHWAIEGQPSANMGYRVLTSYTRGWGTYGTPYKEVKSNVNLLLELSYTNSRLSGWSANLDLAADWGRMLGRSFGAAVTLKKSGLLTR